MADENQDKKPKRVPQEWKPNGLLVALQKIWMVLFGAFKIALGAAMTVLIICVVCGLVLAGALGNYLDEDVAPLAGIDLENLQLNEVSSMYYVDRDTQQIKLLREIVAEETRIPADYEDFPEDLIHAAVAIEDKRFYEHQGVDWITTIKACAGMFFGGDGAGGSTITQQMIKNVTMRDDVTVQRKVREIFDATKCEKIYDKQTIMYWYLNSIFFAESSRGVRAAARAYFGKEVQTLTTAECACLISITNSPYEYNPYDHPVANRERRLLVLEQMLEQGWITREKYDEAVAQEPVLKRGIDLEDRITACPNESCGKKNFVKDLRAQDGHYYCPQCGTEIFPQGNGNTGDYTYFEDAVILEVAEALAMRDGANFDDKEVQKVYLSKLQNGGYSIYTTFDPVVQEKVDAIYLDITQIPDTYSDEQLLSAITIVDNRTGDIVAMAGGVGEKQGSLGWNIATRSKLQTGSSIKPLSVYAPAFETGKITPATVMPDMPFYYEGGEPYPLNSDFRYTYRTTVFTGIVDSINAVAVHTLDGIGTQYSFNYAKNQFGLSGLVESYVDDDGTTHTDIDYGPLALGAQTFGVSVRDMTCAFATFANNGTYRQGRLYTKVYDRDGNLVIDNTQTSRTILSEKTVRYINYCLANAVRSGTGYEAAFSGTEICGKTGSTARYCDRWFCGYTNYYTAAVWCGYNIAEPIRVAEWGVSNPAAYLWRKVMEPVHEGKPYADLYTTSGMTSVTVCRMSGKIATDACKDDIRVADGYSSTQSVMLYPEDVETAVCDKHIAVDYCTTGKGVATQYCRLFEQEKLAVIEKRSLVKMTLEELDEIRKAKRHGLDNAFLRNDYIYLVNADGTDAVFTGIDDDIHQDSKAPYLECSVHTKEAWEKYLSSTVPTTPPTEPTVPTVPHTSAPTDSVQ